MIFGGQYDNRLIDKFRPQKRFSYFVALFCGWKKGVVIGWLKEGAATLTRQSRFTQLCGQGYYQMTNSLATGCLSTCMGCWNILNFCYSSWAKNTSTIPPNTLWLLFRFSKTKTKVAFFANLSLITNKKLVLE